MARLSFLEHHTLQPGGQGQAKPLCLRNPDYAKMRKRVELSFPDQPETAKVKKQTNPATPDESKHSQRGRPFSAPALLEGNRTEEGSGLAREELPWGRPLF